ncbi:SEL1-like repeat protein [Helicobacter typhlonius]|uniref:SEL1-like repeat protein n=1 Tax=Helicobacter typhlonius TaxID=76936 RepID=UPI002FDFC0F0
MANDDKACFNLAEMFMEGKGVKKDRQKAMEYYGLSCDFGFQEGCDEYKALKLKEK